MMSTSVHRAAHSLDCFYAPNPSRAPPCRDADLPVMGLAVAKPFNRLVRMSGAGRGMTSHTNEAVLRRFYDDAFSKGRLSVVDELADRNFVDHDTPLPGFKSGAEGLKQFIGAMRTGFPDLRIAVNDLASQGDKIWARATVTGTPKGSFMNIPPTAKTISFEVI